jgi:hypothetical protein
MMCETADGVVGWVHGVMQWSDCRKVCVLYWAGFDEGDYHWYPEAEIVRVWHPEGRGTP